MATREFEPALRSVIRELVEHFQREGEPLTRTFHDFLTRGSRTDAIIACPSFPQLAAAVEADPGLSIRLLEEPPEGGWAAVNRNLKVALSCVLSFLEEYVDCHGQMVFDNDAFTTVFDTTMQNLFADDTFQVSPVYNLDLAAPVDLGDGLQLRKVSLDEVNIWVNVPGIKRDRLLPIILPSMHCAIEIRYDHQDLTPDEIGNLIDLPGILLNALRLVSGGAPWIAFSILERRGRIRPVRDPRPGTNRIEGKLAQIDADRADTLKAIWSKVRDNELSDGVAMAYRRWCTAAERTTNEDKLVDYWIGLEALFATGGMTEITFRAALRIAMFLGTSGPARQQMYDEMQDCYSWRSAIVHGSGDPGKKVRNRVGLERTTELAGSYLREALLKILLSSEEFQAPNIEKGLLGISFPGDGTSSGPEQ